MELITTKKTKIVCTIGPASDTAEMIYKLYQAGMNLVTSAADRVFDAKGGNI